MAAQDPSPKEIASRAIKNIKLFSEWAENRLKAPWPRLPRRLKKAHRREARHNLLCFFDPNNLPPIYFRTLKGINRTKLVCGSKRWTTAFNPKFQWHRRNRP